MANKFLRVLSEKYPDLAATALQLNADDKWKMKPRKLENPDGATTSSTSTDSSSSCSTCRSTPDNGAPKDDDVNIRVETVSEALPSGAGLGVGAGADSDVEMSS